MSAKMAQTAGVSQYLMLVAARKQSNQRIFPFSYRMPDKGVIQAAGPNLSQQCCIHVANVGAVPQGECQNGFPHFIKRAGMA